MCNRKRLEIIVVCLSSRYFDNCAAKNNLSNLDRTLIKSSWKIARSGKNYSYISYGLLAWIRNKARGSGRLGWYTSTRTKDPLLLHPRYPLSHAQLSNNEKPRYSFLMKRWLFSMRLPDPGWNLNINMNITQMEIFI